MSFHEKKRICRKKSHNRRPRTVLDGQHRPRNCHALLALLTEHLRRGHPDSQETADDLLNIATELDCVVISEKSRRMFIRRLLDLDRVRESLQWPEIADQLHVLLNTVIVRLQHTHPRKPKMLRLPSAADLNRRG